MFADYDFYVNNYRGSKIQNAEEYQYLGQKAARYIMRYTNEVNTDTKECECALAEYLQIATKSNGINSETIPNAYSVSYGTKDKTTIEEEIGEILGLYLGDLYSSVGIVHLIG